MLIIDMPMPKEKYVNVRIFAGGTATVSTDEKPYYKEMPVGELVTCGECKHRFVDGENVRYNVCELTHNKVQSDDWFCADGERKDGEHE